MNDFQSTFEYIPEDPNTVSINFYYLIDNVPAVKIKLEEDLSKVSIFYEANATYRNQGYASEALGLTIDYVFNNLAIFEIHAFTMNQQSKHIAMKNGFLFPRGDQLGILTNPNYQR